MDKIDPAEYKERLNRLGEIFSDITQHAAQQSLLRCPYKNRHGECTAKFGCRFQKRTQDQDGALLCTSNDNLDYRSAWEAGAEDYDKMREKLQRKKSSTSTGTGHVYHADECSPSVAGKTIFDFADKFQVRVPTSCGRTGFCHECVVEIIRGEKALNAPTEAESFLTNGPSYRLACQAEVIDADHDIEFSLLRRQTRILLPESGETTDLAPCVTRHDQEIRYGNDPTAIDHYRGRICGLAIDLGTTTVVCELVDLETGHSLHTTSFENPQRFGGSDVMYRISYDAGPHQGELHRAIINCLNTEIQQMCAAVGIDRHVIYEIVVAGNSTMRDLFFGLDVQSIGQKPYKSQRELDFLAGKRESLDIVELARKLRIRANKNARVWGVPLIASHVGGDIVADLVAINAGSHDGLMMLVDVGTNTEVVLGTPGRFLTASCPAGPAFEGGLVKHGMPGCDGAIESIWRDGDGFSYDTIGNLAPSGICGSGLIQLLAELRRHEMMTPKGVFANKAREFDLVPDRNITVSREDASHLAQAKAASYCGQVILMRTLGIQPQDIQRLYLAGGFANYVNTIDAIEIGFLAAVPEDRIVKVGNAAARGARQLLLSVATRQRAAEWIGSIEHIELETTEDFFEIFVEGCQFKPMDQAEV
ncbi:MAG: ASKHA domain-containing protein [Pirellulaceae bacterium]|nr:ASKHA domain-containing protein [Pirellulaceae bacterium]